MIEIRDTGTRQIQPKELKFLSDANKIMIKAFGGAILAMCGCNELDAIVLDGLMVNVTNKPGMPIRCAVSSGHVYYKNELYSVEAFESTLQSVNEIANLSLSLNTDAVVVPPSPVYDKNLSKTVNVHLMWKGYVSFNQNLIQNGFAFDASNTIYPALKRINQFQIKNTGFVIV